MSALVYSVFLCVSDLIQLWQSDVIRVRPSGKIPELRHTSLCSQFESGFLHYYVASLCQTVTFAMRDFKPLCLIPNDGRHGANPGPVFMRKFALDGNPVRLCLTIVTVSISGNRFLTSESRLSLS